MTPRDVVKLFLIRHGIAADNGPDGTDESRPLTAEGVAELREEAAGLNRLNARLNVILTSPLVRARQTAAALAAHLDGKPPIVVAAALAPFGAATALAATLRQHQHQERVALVGHDPGISHLAARWLGQTAPFAFKKGAVCRIDFPNLPEDAQGLLRWFATPKMLRLLSR